jgi:hypothetical protein|tara:strand:- start:296 stop:415 length:120 start_codon:yes stop_codon:yes gene_type:complete
MSKPVKGKAKGVGWCKHLGKKGKRFAAKAERRFAKKCLS